jgi:hypothetical protein
MRTSSSGSEQELPAYTIDSSVITDQVEPSLLHHGTPGDQGSETTPRTYEMLHSIAAGLLDLGRPIPASELTGASQPYSPLDNSLLPLEPQSNPSTANQSYEDDPEDGLFVPGSAYFEFHSALRNHTFQAARTTVPPRHGAQLSAPTTHSVNNRATSFIPTTATSTNPGDTRGTDLPAQFHNLTPHEEYELWRNWIEEIAPWVTIPLKQVLLCSYILTRRSWTSLTSTATLAMSYQPLQESTRTFGSLRSLCPHDN